MTAASRDPAVRASYDLVAVEHARRLREDPVARPLDRAMLDAFAAHARDAGGAVADLGCGPGRVTAYLARRGLRAFGVDLSPAMVAVARRTYPGLRFEVGRMAALDVADGALGGVVAWHGTAHLPQRELPDVFAEFARVLAPGGHALVTFDAAAVPDRQEPAAHAPEPLADLLAGAGLPEAARMVREPAEGEPGPRGFVLARKPRTP